MKDSCVCFGNLFSRNEVIVHRLTAIEQVHFGTGTVGGEDLLGLLCLFLGDIGAEEDVDKLAAAFSHLLCHLLQQKQEETICLVLA